MKKLFVSVLAIAAMVACMNEETVRLQDPAAIGFEANWVENATRANEAVDPSTTTESLSGFDVWGYMENTSGVIFEGEDVSGEKGNFTYMNTAYWNPGHKYYFSALAPMNSENAVVTPVASGVVPAGLGVVEFTNVKGAEDLLYAFAEVEAPAAGQNKVVNFTFKHLLSKVKFSFTNGFTNPNNTIDVKNVKMTVPAEGTIDLNAGYVWENLDGALTLEFGDACAKTAVAVKQEAADERLTIPAGADKEYVITFDVVLYNGDVVAYKGTKTSKVTGVALEMGKAYNFAATLNAENFTAEGDELMPIEFDVAEVENWVEAGDVAIDATTVATAAELVAAIAEGGEIRLTEDINLDEIATTRAAYDSYGLAIEKDCVIDGNGKKLTSTVKRAIAVCEPVNVTLKNFTLETTGERGVQVQAAANVTIENVVATSANYTLNIPTSGANAQVTINDCDFKGLNVINVWGENALVNINNTTLRCEDNNAAESYAVVANAGLGAVVNVNGGEVIITGSNTEGTNAGSLEEENAEVNFNGTEGNCVVEGHSFAINYTDGYRYTFATFEAALAKALPGETIKLLKNVNLTQPIEITKKAIIDLNGKNLTADTFLYPGNTVVEDSYAFWVKDGGDLTINGEGEISTASCPYSIAVWAQGGKVTINGGKFFNAGEGSDLIYASANGHVVINGGEFKACEKQAGVNGTLEAYSALNLKGDGTGSSITCYGGRFFKFNPADNKSENPAVSFVAPGKTVEVDGDWFVVK